MRALLCRSFVALSLGLALAACASNNSTNPGTASVDGGPDVGATAEGGPKVVPVPFQHQELYDSLTLEAEKFTISGGDWLEDQGDATFFGLGFYGRTGKLPDRYAAARTRALSLMKDADFFNGDLQEMIMAPLGIIDDIDQRRTNEGVAELDAFVDRLDGLVKLLGWYIELDAERSWALQLYGPTTISALLGLVNAQYGMYVDSPKRAERVAWAREMERKVNEKAWNGKYYEFGLGKPGPDLYPNIAMLILEARLYQLTGIADYRTRALAIYDAIQELKLEDSPTTRYYSAYSAEKMGAKTRDYSTLSVHNYVALGMLVLYEITGETRFAAEADRVVSAMAKLHGSWCLSHMHPGPAHAPTHEVCEPACSAGNVCVANACTADQCSTAILHHWIDGRNALPTDAEFFCSGCNLQLLWVLWYRSERVAKGLAPTIPMLTEAMLDAGGDPP